MFDWNWHILYQTFLNSLKQGNPPLYMQLSVATAIYVVLQVYFFWKRKKRSALTPSPEWVTTIWIGVLILLSLGVVEEMQYFYREYLRTIYYNIVT